MSLSSTPVDGHAGREGGSLLRLKTESFDAATEAVGCTSEISRARLLGVTDRTLNRARQGIIGEKFIARTLAAMKPHARTLAKCGIKPTFEEFFEVL